ncbi:MAG: hypothetical protein BEN18_02750 [Epulopiscium sp. Nuni2H_MBin001]|nr:MAG: hypothetical protein BEN18_02750 [Epulopiscium sp. Nuni2H_MBin001]
MISMVVALSRNNIIGDNNTLPWHIPEDLQFFKQLTTGHTIVMGRKTFDSIGRALPNRNNVVLTRNLSFNVDGVNTITDFNEVFSMPDEVFIIGGGEIYNLFMPYTHKLYITLVDKVIKGDTSFPNYDEFICIKEVPKQDTSCELDYTFTQWIRK